MLVSLKRMCALALLVSAAACGGGGGGGDDESGEQGADLPSITIQGGANEVIKAGETRTIAVTVGQELTLVASEPPTGVHGSPASGGSCNYKLEYSPNSRIIPYHLTILERNSLCSLAFAFPEGTATVVLDMP